MKNLRQQKKILVILLLKLMIIQSHKVETQQVRAGTASYSDDDNLMHHIQEGQRSAISVMPILINISRAVQMKAICDADMSLQVKLTRSTTHNKSTAVQGCERN